MISEKSADEPIPASHPDCAPKTPPRRHDHDSRRGSFRRVAMPLARLRPCSAAPAAEWMGRFQTWTSWLSAAISKALSSISALLRDTASTSRITEPVVSKTTLTANSSFSAESSCCWLLISSTIWAAQARICPAKVDASPSTMVFSALASNSTPVAEFRTSWKKIRSSASSSFLVADIPHKAGHEPLASGHNWRNADLHVPNFSVPWPPCEPDGSLP